MEDCILTGESRELRDGLDATGRLVVWAHLHVVGPQLPVWAVVTDVALEVAAGVMLHGVPARVEGQAMRALKKKNRC